MKLMLADLETAHHPSATVWMYLIYLAISLALTIWVARTLHKEEWPHFSSGQLPRQRRPG